MKKVYLLSYLICLSQFLPAQKIDSAYTLQTEEGPVVGTLTLTEKKPENLVIIIPGSGPTDRNGNNTMGLTTNSYLMISKALAEEGISSLRYDKKGIGASTQVAEENLTFNTYVNDLIHWVEKIKKEIKPENLVLLGHSEGSLISMLAAEQIQVDGLISVAAPSLPADSLLLLQLNKQPGLYSMAKPVVDSLSQGYQVKQVPPMLVALFRPSVQPYLISWFRYDPQQVISNLDIPILILHGNNDIQVSHEQARSLADAAGDNATIRIIDKMNHVLKTGSEDDMAANMATYSQPELPLNQEFMPEVVNFTESLN